MDMYFLCVIGEAQNQERAFIVGGFSSSIDYGYFVIHHREVQLICLPNLPQIFKAAPDCTFPYILCCSSILYEKLDL
jgi:hypothetical protein